MSQQNDYFENYELSDNLEYYNTFESEELGLNDEILKGIYSYGFEKPSQIQRVGIKPIIDGKDVVIQSHSGSGKTATFIIGLLQRMDPLLKEPQCIIISNTRELADQTLKVFTQIAKYTNFTCNLCIGGDMQYKYNANNVKENVIIGTPGRMCDLMNKDIIKSDNIKLIIVDEADDVLSISFRKQVKRIFQKIPKESQVVLVSATIPTEMSELFNSLMKPDFSTILVKNEELTLDGISQYYINIDEQYKLDALTDLYKFISIGQAIIYCNKKSKTEELKYCLTDKSFSVSVLHGDMMQKERDDVMKEFRSGKTRILVTTDILSRGIDIQQISLVINYDMPLSPQTYLHRIGRGSRYGRRSTTINFVIKRENNILNHIRKLYNTKIIQLPSNVSELL